MGETATPSPVAAATQAAPSLLWQQARRINILCQLSTAHGNDVALERRLCEQVRAIAAVGTLGDGAVVLLVHASSESVAGHPLLSFTIRPYRQSAGDGAALFGTAPRAVSVDAGLNGAAVEASLRASLAEILPWLAGGNAPRPL